MRSLPARMLIGCCSARTETVTRTRTSTAYAPAKTVFSTVRVPTTVYQTVRRQHRW